MTSPRRAVAHRLLKVGQARKRLVDAAIRLCARHRTMLGGVEIICVCWDCCENRQKLQRAYDALQRAERRREARRDEE